MVLIKIFYVFIGNISHLDEDIGRAITILREHDENANAQTSNDADEKHDYNALKSKELPYGKNRNLYLNVQFFFISLQRLLVKVSIF